MYHITMLMGPRNGQDGEGSCSLVFGGGGPLPQELGQPHLGRGGYGGPPSRPPEGGGGSDVPGGGSGGRPNLNLVLPFGSLTNGGLKGTTPTIFNENCKNTKQYIQKFTLYRMINQDSNTMWNAYTRTALVLLFMWGTAINDWMLQQTERLYLKCNGDLTNGIVLTYQMDDERLWVEFGHDFHCAFTDTALEQRAYGKLANCTMGNKSIDKYIAQFEHLLQKVGWDCILWGSLFQFKKGLDRKIHLKILQKEPMPAEACDAWEEAAQHEVERQAFIDASLGPKEF